MINKKIQNKTELRDEINLILNSHYLYEKNHNIEFLMVANPIDLNHVIL